MARQPTESTVSRPAVTWVYGLLWVLAICGLGFALALIIRVMLPDAAPGLYVLTELCIIFLFVLTARPTSVLAIRLYQRYAPARVRLRCAMTPSCSEYAVLAISRYGVLRGIGMTYRRLRYRCDGTPITDYP